MSSVTYGFASSRAYRASGALTSRQRLAAWGAVVGLHVAVIGGLALARMGRVEPEPEPTLMVSFVSQNASPTLAPTPPQPQPPVPTPPEPQPQVTPQTPQPPTLAPKLVASARSTSAMSAAPAETPLVDPLPTPAPTAPAPAAPPPAAEAGGAAGPVTPPDFTAAYLRNPGPKYPEASRRKKEEGVVLLRVRVSVDGSPDQVSVQRSSGSEDLDRAAVDVVQSKWKFVPAKQAGRAVAGVALIPLKFSLKTR